MLTADVVTGMIKLHLYGYVSYDELVGWALDKFTEEDYIEDLDDEQADVMFDVLSRIVTEDEEGDRLTANDFAYFINRLDSPQPTLS